MKKILTICLLTCTLAISAQTVDSLKIYREKVAELTRTLGNIETYLYYRTKEHYDEFPEPMKKLYDNQLPRIVDIKDDVDRIDARIEMYVNAAINTAINQYRKQHE